MEKVLIIAAHPDDEVLGCGASISKWVKADIEVTVLFLAEGSTARYSLNEIDGKPAQQEVLFRNQCAQKALNILGVKTTLFENLLCGRLDREPIIDLGKKVEKTILDLKPDTIFTHSPQDVNVDHQLCFQATLQATRPGAMSLVKRLFSFEVLSSSEWRFHDQFSPNYFIDVTKDLEKKIDAMYAFKSEVREFPHPRSREGITALAMYRGLQANCKYAEAFQLIREIP